MTRSHHRQRGAAILTAMIIVTLVATLASAMVWQQWRAVQVEAAERARSQAAWVLNGALDWARLILREDARGSQIDHLGEPWAVPLAEARLSTFLAADRDRTDDAPEAFLAGRIDDAQARYNLRNLIDGENKIAPAELATLRRLFETVQASPERADQLAAALRTALAGPQAGQQGGGAIALLPHDVSQLAWLGLDAETIERLRPFIVLLPTPTPVNINTAPREVLAALAEGMDMAVAERIVQARARNPINGEAELKALLPTGVSLGARIDTKTTYFEVRGRLRVDDRALEER